MTHRHELDSTELEIYNALLPIAVDIVGQRAFACEHARDSLEISLSYCGMLIAIASGASLDDERYGPAGSSIRDDIDIEVHYREEQGMAAHEDTGDTAVLRDTMESEMGAAIKAIQGAPKHYRARVRGKAGSGLIVGTPSTIGARHQR
jgi:hypothetical protein